MLFCFVFFYIQIFLFFQPVPTGSYILNITGFVRDIKIFIFLTYHLCSPAGRSLLCMLLGLLTALSYSDLVKSWRGECGGGGIVGNHTCGPP